MKKIILAGLFSLSLLGGFALAQQSGEKKQESPTHGMMQEMMKGGKTGEGSMGGMEGMMRMMKMMEQCSAMMERCCQTTGSEETKDSQKK